MLPSESWSERSSAARLSSTVMTPRWISPATSSVMVSSSTENMPSRATSSPLITDVASRVTPVVVPTSPLARSRRSGSISRVTMVIIAIPRTLPAITPNIASTTNTHNQRLDARVNAPSGASW